MVAAGIGEGDSDGGLLQGISVCAILDCGVVCLGTYALRRLDEILAFMKC